MSRKFLLVSKPAYKNYQIPYLWTTAKTYYEQHGKYSSEWEWADPLIEHEGWEEALDHIIEQKPDLVGFSVYVWNEGSFNKIAKNLREKLPNCQILFGGPQCDAKHNKEYFREKPYVDLVVPGDAYGELILTAVLDSISDNDGVLDARTIPYCFYPGKNRDVVFQDVPIDKKNFAWTDNAFRRQQDYFDRHREEINPPMLGKFMLETSRGCPYRCSFCDWGGGTYTKTIKKPFGTVMDEIRWAAENQFQGVYITDANFGLFDIDIEYAKHLAKMKEEHGYPKNITIQPTKSKLHNLEKIFDIFCASKQLPYFKLSVEDLNENVLKNVDRVDFPFEEKMEMVSRLLKKYPNMEVLIEGILGLPGSSLNTVIKDINRTVGYGIDFPNFYHWLLLPETPAYDPTYREKFKIGTIKHKVGITDYHTPIRLKEGHEARDNVQTIVTDDINITAEYVVETISYSKEEYIKMHSLQTFVSSNHNTGLLSKIARYLNTEHSIDWGDFYNETKEVLLSHNKLGTQYALMDKAIHDWVYGDNVSMFVDPDPNFRYEIHINNYLLFLAMTNADLFFECVGQHWSKKVSDERILDLANYSKNTVITLEYQPGIAHTVDHNWKEYFDGEALTNVSSTYQGNDAEIAVGQSMEKIDWGQYKGTPDYLTHFFYRVCYIIGNKEIKHIERI